MNANRSMNKMRLYVALALLPLVLAAASAQPVNLYLTYSGDPSTSIDINFHTIGSQHNGAAHWDVVPHDGKRRQYEYSGESEIKRIDGLPVERTLHTVRLTGLEPNTTYYFVAGNRRAGFSEERSFKTLPDGDAPIRFVMGGDIGIGLAPLRLLEQAAKFDPTFCLIGGDIAYANGELSNYRIWDRWFKNWDEKFITSDGRMVPMIAAIGNHETNDAESTNPHVVAPFFFGYFGQQVDRTYFDFQFGDNFAIIALDTGHITPHVEQVDFLRAALEKYRNVPFRFAVYHVPLYPSHRDYEGGGSVAGRTHWAPLFDEYGLTAGFENHDHTLKRTHLIKNNKVDPDGTLYIGDGSFGRNPREVGPDRRWYEVIAAQVYHFWVIDVTPEKVSYQAVNENGEVLDRYEQLKK